MNRLILLIVAAFSAAPLPADERSTNHDVVEGQLEIVWGDPLAGTGAPALKQFSLATDDGERVALLVSAQLAAAHGGFLDWFGRRVRVHLDSIPDKRVHEPRPGTRRGPRTPQSSPMRWATASACRTRTTSTATATLTTVRGTS